MKVCLYTVYYVVGMVLCVYVEFKTAVGICMCVSVECSIVVCLRMCVTVKCSHDIWHVYVCFFRRQEWSAVAM